MQKYLATSLSALLVFGTVASPVTAEAQWDSPPTATPVKHVVVIFGENISFDHYWGTYPYATNPAGEPKFYPAPGTPTVNGLNDASAHQQSEFPEHVGERKGCGESIPAGSFAGCNRGSGPRLHAGTGSLPWRVDGFVSGVHGDTGTTAQQRRPPLAW